MSAPTLSFTQIARALPGAMMRSLRPGRKVTSEPSGGRRLSIPMKTAADIYVDEMAALTLSVLWGGVHAISEALAASHWQVFREDTQGNRTPIRGRYYDLLNYEPNPEMTPFDFRMTLCMNALLSHGGYAEIVPDGAGRPAQLWPIAADRVERVRDENGELWFRVSNYYGPDAMLHHTEMFWIRGRSLDGEASLKMVDCAREVLARAIATRDFGSSFYANGLHLGGLLMPKNGTNYGNAEERQKFVDQLREMYSGARNANDIHFLPAELEYKELGVDPDKAQFILTEQHLVEEICRYLRMPPHKVQHLQRSTNNNIEHQGIEFVRDTLTPWAERLRQEADRKILFADRMVRTRIDLDWLREGDALSVANTESVRIHSGQSNPDEARRRRGENPVPGGAGKKFVMQRGMTTLENVGVEDAPEEDDGDLDLNPARDKGPRPSSKTASRAPRAVGATVMPFTLPAPGEANQSRSQNDD